MSSCMYVIIYLSIYVSIISTQIMSYTIGWCQRIKSEFKFEYAYLEDELGPSPPTQTAAGGDL